MLPRAERSSDSAHRVLRVADPPEPPAHFPRLIARLIQAGFEEVETTYSPESFGNLVRVFERAPIRVRIVRDRGEWSAEMNADGWPRHDHFGDDWVLLPPVFSEEAG